MKALAAILLITAGLAAVSLGGVAAAFGGFAVISSVLGLGYDDPIVMLCLFPGLVLYFGGGQLLAHGLDISGID